MNKFLEYSGTEGRSDTSTASKLLLAIVGQSTHSFPPGGGGATPLYGLYGDVELERVWFSSSLSVYNFARVCPTQGIQFRASLS